MPENFTFGIPLIARSSAQDWNRVQMLLNLTVTSLLAQSDQNFRIVVAGHDQPDIPMGNCRIEFLKMPWPAEPVLWSNPDGGRKRFAISDYVLENGGGLLMFVDADDVVDVELVKSARRAIGPELIGGIVESGYATDLKNLKFLEIPHLELFDAPFYRLCGSSTVARLRPDVDDPLFRNPHKIFHEHHRWRELANEHNVTLASLPVSGNYTVNTSENHSELHGPYSDWRRSFNGVLRKKGRRVDSRFLQRYGITMDYLHQLTDLVSPPERDHRDNRTGGIAQQSNLG